MNLTPHGLARVALRAALAIVALAWIAYLGLLFRGELVLLKDLLPGFAEAQAALGPLPDSSIPGVVGVFLLAVSACLALVVPIVRDPDRWLTDGRRQAAFRYAVLAFAAWVLVDGALNRVPEAPWYSIVAMMTNPSDVSVFGQRLLLIWPAVILREAVPALTPVQAFLTVQAIAYVALVWVFERWSAIFGGERLALLGPLILVAIVTPTMTYRTAHDVGVLLTFTLCFLFAYQRRYVALLVAFALAVLNHRIAMLLVPTMAFALWGHDRHRRVVAVVAAMAFTYLLLDAILQRIVPLAHTFEHRVWWNVRLIGEVRRTMIFSLATLVPLVAIAVVAYRDADPFLRRAIVLFPLTFAIYAIVGQLNEPRAYYGVVPILAGLAIGFVDRHWRAGARG